METYTVRIQHFEGPFDLLLYFIQRDELDINDIPIAQITKDFLEYIKQLEELNLDVAAEFILVAATLMRIKAKMLIPRKEVDEEGNEIDPRDELVQKLLEYKKYKEVLEQFSNLEKERSLKIQRGNALEELKLLSEKALVDVELESVNTYKLLKTFKRVLERYKNLKDRYVHEIVKYPYTVLEQQTYIKDRLVSEDRITFEDLFDVLDNRMHAIVTFLALLELVNAQEIELIDGLQVNSFWIEFKKVDNSKNNNENRTESELPEDSSPIVLKIEKDTDVSASLVEGNGFEILDEAFEMEPHNLKPSESIDNKNESIHKDDEVIKDEEPKANTVSEVDGQINVGESSEAEAADLVEGKILDTNEETLGIETVENVPIDSSINVDLENANREADVLNLVNDDDQEAIDSSASNLTNDHIEQIREAEEHSKELENESGKVEFDDLEEAYKNEHLNFEDISQEAKSELDDDKSNDGHESED